MLRQETVSSREVILIVSGPLTGPAVEEFHQKMEDLSSGRFQKIVLDLAQCPSINSAALGKLLYFRKKLDENGGTLEVGGCSDGVYRVFTAIKFDRLIPVRK
jgi:anti-anti-sigma factor